VRYIRELETALENKVNTEGGLDLPDLDMFTENSLVFSLDRVSKSLEKPAISNHNDDIRHSRIDLRNFVSQFIITPQRGYVHECSEILHGLNKTSISDTNVDRE
jgi:hypothetical protein